MTSWGGTLQLGLLPLHPPYVSPEQDERLSMREYAEACRVSLEEFETIGDRFLWDCNVVGSVSLVHARIICSHSPPFFSSAILISIALTDRASCEATSDNT